jgi:hypothetical protein
MEPERVAVGIFPDRRYKMFNHQRKHFMLTLAILALAGSLFPFTALAANGEITMLADGKPFYRDQSLRVTEGEFLQLQFILADEQGETTDITKNVKITVRHDDAKNYFSIDENGRIAAHLYSNETGYPVDVSFGDWSSYFFVNVKAAIPQFTDIDGHWAEEAIKWGAESGYVRGYGDGTFRPDQYITEEEFLAFFIQPRTDPAMLARGVYGFAEIFNMPVAGLHDFEARKAPITRAKVAEIIVGADGVNFSGEHAIQYVLGKGYSQGRSAPTIEGYEGEGYLTRAEAMVFSFRLLDVLETITKMPEEPTSPSELPELP